MAGIPDMQERYIDIRDKIAGVNKPFDVNGKTYILYSHDKHTQSKGVLCTVEFVNDLHAKHPRRTNPISFCSVYNPGSILVAMDIPQYLNFINK